MHWKYLIWVFFVESSKNATFLAKQKHFTFEIKNVVFRCFGEEDWKKLLLQLRSAPSSLSKCKNSCKTKKPQNMVLKILLFGCFKLEFVKKNFCHIWLSHPWTFQNAKFHVKQNFQIWDIKDLIWIFLDWNLKNHQ